jgi:uncharacterized membrane protein
MDKKLLYLSAVSVAITTIIVLSHTKNFHASQMCVISDTDYWKGAVVNSSSIEAGYNFLEAEVDHSIN